MRAVLLSGLVAVLVGGLLGVSAPGRATGQSVLLVYHFHTGTHFSLQTQTSYTTHSNQADTPDEHNRYQVLETIGVDRVYPDGSALLRLRFAQLQVQQHGTQQRYGTTSYQLIEHLSTTGTVLSEETSGANPLADAGTNPFTSLYLPELPAQSVRVGDQWPVTLSDPTSAKPTETRDILHPRATLQALTADVATISLHGAGSFRAAQTGTATTVTGVLTGTMRLALASGTLLGEDLREDVMATPVDPHAPPSALRVTFHFGVHAETSQSVVPDTLPSNRLSYRVLGTATGANQNSTVTIDDATGLAFITDQEHARVAEVSTIRGNLVRMVRVGRGPTALAVDAAHGHVLVLNSGSTPEAYAHGLPRTRGSITVLDAATGRALATVAIGTNPRAIAVDAPAQRAYVTDNSPRILVLDTATMRQLRPIVLPEGLSPGKFIVDAAAGRLVVLAWGAVSNASVVTVNLATATVSAPVALAGDDLDYLLYDAATQRAIVFGDDLGAHGGAGTLNIVDLRHGGPALVKRGLTPSGGTAALASHEGHLFIMDDTDGRLLLLDARTGAVLRRTPIQSSGIMVVDEGRGLLFMAQDMNSVAAIDLKTGSIVGSIGVGGTIGALAVDSTSGRLLVLDSVDGTISLLGR